MYLAFTLQKKDVVINSKKIPALLICSKVIGILAGLFHPSSSLG
jgi:hypothetical protein